MSAWYEAPEAPPRGTWWWAVEHRGHPAFYLRALLPGDHAPGRVTAARHVLTLGGLVLDDVHCGTCGEVPRAEDLEPIERATGDRGHLAAFRDGRVPWPRPTDRRSCWLCSGPARLATREINGRMHCEACASHLGE